MYNVLTWSSHTDANKRWESDRGLSIGWEAINAIVEWDFWVEMLLSIFVRKP